MRKFIYLFLLGLLLQGIFFFVLFNMPIKGDDPLEWMAVLLYMFPAMVLASIAPPFALLVPVIYAVLFAYVVSLLLRLCASRNQTNQPPPSFYILDGKVIPLPPSAEGREYVKPILE